MSDMTWDLDYCIEPVYDNGYWTTKSGERLDIREMETSHIKNTINLLKKKSQQLDEDEKLWYGDYFDFKITEFEKELKIRDVYARHIMEDKNV